MEKLCDGKGQYGTSEKSNGLERGLPVLGMPHIHEGRIRWERMWHAELAPEDVAKYRLQEGDILFNRTNSAELVGKSAVFDGRRDAIFASYLVRFRTIPEKADPHFVVAYINSRHGRAYVERNMARASGQVNISASTMLRLEIPCPLLSVQKRASAYLAHRRAEAEMLKGHCRTELKAIQALPAALLREVFGAGESNP